MTWTDAAVAIAIAIGIVGILVPVLPGSLLVLAAIIVWAMEVGTTAGWVFAAVATSILVVGAVVKFALPGKRLKATVPTRTLLLGAVGAVAGFFLLPVVGALVGFPLGVYLAEHRRLGAEQAWPSTRAALRAVGLSILVEFVAAVLAALVWVAGVVWV